MIVTLTIPLPPSSNGLFKNVHRKGSKGRARTNKYDAWIEEAGWALLQQHPAKLKGPVELEIWIEEPKTECKIDIDNRVKALCDLLVSHQVIEADHNKIVRSIKLSWSPIEGCHVQIVSVAERGRAAA